MRRNNEERLMTGQHKPNHTEEVPRMANPMDFVTPTDLVELPSKGRYPEGHPLHGETHIEIKHMTAKDEDILTNRGLLKEGLAIDRLIQNVIKDNSIDGRYLYAGDRNAIMIRARASAYGNDYKTKAQCPACGSTQGLKIDLAEQNLYDGEGWKDTDIQMLENKTFQVTLPVSTIVVNFKPLNGFDELSLIKRKSKKDDPMDNILTKQMKLFVISLNGYDDEQTVNYVCDNMVASDAKFLRQAFRLVSPEVKIEKDFKCKECDHEEVVAVPFGTDFFWPDR